MVSSSSFEQLIHKAYQDRSTLKDESVVKAVLQIIDELDQGLIRVAEPTAAGAAWKVNDWIKKALLLYIGMQKMEAFDAGPFEYADKVPIKKRARMPGVRVVPGAVVRTGAFVEKGAVLMPSFVNLGAYVGEGTMVDTWATVGSCAQVGKRVHLSGGVGVGGVLEPPQAAPVVIEDNVFVGSRCIIVEGAHVCEGAVLGANVVITATTRVIDVSGAEPKEYQGYVPARSVVIPGVRQKQFPAGMYGVPCALIIGQRKASTDEKTSLNDVLRDYQVSV